MKDQCLSTKSFGPLIQLSNCRVNDNFREGPMTAKNGDSTKRSPALDV